MYKKVTIALIGVLAAFCTLGVWAADAANPAEAPNANDPTVSQVYDAARAGHLDQAKQMMALVLANHPHSARAHYVAAEIDADTKNYGDARQELKTAEGMDPGLPFANPQSVAALRKEIGESPAAAQAAPARAPYAAPAMARPAAKAFPWTMVWVIAAIVFVLWLLFRRRSTPAVYGAPGPGTMGPSPSGFPNVVAGGSGIMGGLASGLAVGAGIAAGEELVHGFENRHEGAGAPIAPEPNEGPANSDLGGPDFGVSDPGGGWDDGGGGGSSGDDGGGWT